jgi:VIT1/CCC1 family predicted Fe2+/Mn2+ transporter/rubrerythrin
MTANPSTLSTTDKNLWSAIVSEALANLKYNAYAQRAMQEGHPEIAQIFREVADAETVHGINHLRVSGDLATTVENLRAITLGEAREAATIYPRMIQEALAEGNQEAANSFTLAMEQERHHLDAFIEALESLEASPAAQPMGFRPSAVAEIPLMPSGAAASFSTAADGTSQVAAEDAFDRETYNTAASEIDRERWRVARMGRLREVVFGAQDGLLSTVALVTSLAVAVDSQTTVLVAGLAGALPGMISMATGALLGSRAEQDVQRAEIEKEAQELETNPAEELAELVVLFQREGMTFQEARHMADDIAQDRDLWLKTLVEKELGISAEVTSNPVKDALVMGLAFISGAAIPLIPHFFLTGGEAIGVSVGATLAGLFTLGLVKGRLVQRSPLLQGLEILGIGAISAAIGYALGDLIPRLFA